MKPLGILTLLIALALAAWAAYDEAYRSTRGWPSQDVWGRP